jgi:Pyruvate/2-oxoacid:ferredoxin oxidoreductase delta subunit
MQKSHILEGEKMQFDESKDSMSHVKLAKRYSSIFMAGPKMSDDLVTLISYMFTEEQAEIARTLPPYVPVSYKIMAMLKRRPFQEVRSILEEMVDKSVIFRMGNSYSLIPLLPGTMELMMMRNKDDEWLATYARLYLKIFNDGYLKRYMKNTKGLPSITYTPVNHDVEVKNRKVKVNQEIEAENRQVSDDFVAKAIEYHDNIAIVNYCQCRRLTKLTGKECSHGGLTEEDGCLWFGSVAKYFVSQDIARKVSKKEAFQHVAHGKENKAAFFTFNASYKSDLLMICLCCQCCCKFIHVINNFDGQKLVAETEYKIAVNSGLCSNCGACSKVCFTNAHAMVDRKHVYNKDECIGCGVCIDACEKNALQLVRNDKYKKPPRHMMLTLLKLAPEAAMMAIKKSGS